MNRHAINADTPADLTLSVDANPQLLRLRAGSALFVVRGDLWLTQEGRLDDVILTAGSRFDVTGRAPIVVSALKEPAVLYVARPADAHGDATEDVYAFLTEKAHRLRAQQIADAVSRLRERIADAARRLLELGGGRRLPSH